VSLLLYDRPAEGTGYRQNLDGILKGWRRTTRAIGGYYIGKLVIKDLSIMQLTDFYETWLGMKLVEETFGMETWSGIIWQMDLFKNGINYRRTLDRDKTHNRVKVVYTDTSGDQQTIAWSENTNSSGIYGTIEQIYTIGVTGSTAATAFRDNKLTRHAWPLSRQVGSTTVGVPSSKADGLYITYHLCWLLDYLRLGILRNINEW
jgi:hypothetical protein